MRNPLLSQRQWWVVCVGTMGVGDLVTTSLLPRYRSSGMEEGNPAFGWINDPDVTERDVAMRFGATKMLWFALMLTLYSAGRKGERTRRVSGWIPIWFSVVGSVVFASNLLKMSIAESEMRRDRETEAWAERMFEQSQSRSEP